MNIINLRKIGSFEIPDSYMGILRISPNEINGKITDDPTEILKRGELVALSDSAGNNLSINFQCKEVKISTVDGTEIPINLPSQQYNGDLYISNFLKLKSSLIIGKGGLRFNEKFNSGEVSTSYNILAPIDTSYFWYNIKGEDGKIGLNKLSSDLIGTHDEEISKLSIDNPIFTNTENEKYWININGEYQFMAKENSKVPKLKKCDYILGSKYNPDNKNSTKIEFLNLQNLIHEYIKKYLSGIQRDNKHRYFELHGLSDPNRLARDLFGDDVAIEELEETAPIIGIPVQSGTIHYNAIPPHRYFFHLSRRESTNNIIKDGAPSDLINKAIPNTGGPMDTLCTQYILCDGKKIYKKEGNEPSSEYFNINIKKLEKENPLSISDIKETPPLFDINQRTLRFLRGMNWLRAQEVTNNKNEITTKLIDIDLPLNKNGYQPDSLNGDEYINNSIFVENNKSYQKVTSNSSGVDKANHPKNIRELGLYLSSTDKDIQYKLKHSHLIFEDKNVLSPLSSIDHKTDNLKNFINGTSISTIYKQDAWLNYIKSNTNDTFNGSYMLKTVSDETESNKELILKLQNRPITIGGGIPNFAYLAQDCVRWSNKTRRHGVGGHRCKTGSCCKSGNVTIRDTAYYISRVNDNSHNKWRFISSLPQLEEDKKEFLTASYNFLNEDTISNKDIEIIDGAHNPPSMNFIPLMKI